MPYTITVANQGPSDLVPQELEVLLQEFLEHSTDPESSLRP